MPLYSHSQKQTQSPQSACGPLTISAVLQSTQRGPLRSTGQQETHKYHLFSRHPKSSWDKLVLLFESCDFDWPFGLAYIVHKTHFMAFLNSEHFFHCNVWTVWLVKMFQNFPQTGKMSPKWLRWERQLSITGTNMWKRQLKTPKTNGLRKLTEKWAFLQHATPWSVSFSVFFFVSLILLTLHNINSQLKLSVHVCKESEFEL